MHKRWIFTPLAILLLGALTSCASVEDVSTPTHIAAFTPTNTNTPAPTTTETLLEPQFEPILTADDCLTAGLPEIACTGVTENDQWEPVIRKINGIPMALVPAGCFQMGNNDSFPEEQPAHTICFEQPFWIDRTEVTVSQFADFLNGQPEPIDHYDRWLSVWAVIGNAHIQLAQDGHTWHPLHNEDNRPIESVTWFGANDYCAWRQARLPTEAEWEYAARGPDSLLYPWGDEFIRDNIVRFEGSNPEVGSKPRGASWVDALDMSGSQFEWTSSLYRPYPYDPSDGREVSVEAGGVGNRVFKGCAWYHPENYNDNLTAPARFDAPPDYAAWYYGFRCTRSID
jgi:formylglycine-generating enzyme required for sulfatase activity